MKIANNKKAYHNYLIIKDYEAGIVLNGSEIKSIRKGEVSLQEAYVSIRNHEAQVVNMHIAPYKYAVGFIPIDPLRTRKLLLHKKEIIKLEYLQKTQQLTLIPLKMYINGRSLVKLKIGLAKGKNAHDKRQALKQKSDRKINNY